MRGLRALLLVTLLGVLVGTLRADVIHAHEQHEAGHSHAGTLAGGHGHAAHDDDSVVPSLHAHDSLAPALLCGDAGTPSGDASWGATWRSSIDQPDPASSAHGPPHRPPIA